MGDHLPGAIPVAFIFPGSVSRENKSKAYSVMSLLFHPEYNKNCSSFSVIQGRGWSAVNYMGESVLFFPLGGWN